MSVPSVILRRTRRGALLVAAGLLALTGCGSDDDTTNGDTGEQTGDQQTIELTLTDDEIAPMGERVNVEAGEPITFEITADHEGSVHVHSDPEHSLDYTDGTTTHEITLDRPGVVEVEIHDPDVILVQLAVN